MSGAQQFVDISIMNLQLLNLTQIKNYCISKQ